MIWVEIIEYRNLANLTSLFSTKYIHTYRYTFGIDPKVGIHHQMWYPGIFHGMVRPFHGVKSPPIFSWWNHGEWASLSPGLRARRFSAPHSPLSNEWCRLPTYSKKLLLLSQLESLPRWRHPQSYVYLGNHDFSLQSTMASTEHPQENHDLHPNTQAFRATFSQGREGCEAPGAVWHLIGGGEKGPGKSGFSAKEKWREICDFHWFSLMCFDFHWFSSQKQTGDAKKKNKVQRIIPKAGFLTIFASWAVSVTLDGGDTN